MPGAVQTTSGPISCPCSAPTWRSRCSATIRGQPIPTSGSSGAWPKWSAARSGRGRRADAAPRGHGRPLLSRLGIESYGFMPLASPKTSSNVTPCGRRALPRGRPRLRRGGDHERHPALRRRPMRLLVLGGTRFLGRALVGAPLEHGHKPTLSTGGGRTRNSTPSSRAALATDRPISRRSRGATGTPWSTSRRTSPRGTALGRRAFNPRALCVRLVRLRLRGSERPAGRGCRRAELPPATRRI